MSTLIELYADFKGDRTANDDAARFGWPNEAVTEENIKKSTKNCG